MNTKKTYRLISLSLAVLMFFSSVGLVIDFHYCQGKLKNMSLWKKAKSCHELAASSHCHKTTKQGCHKTASEQSCKKGAGQNGCCDNETAIFLLDADYPTAEYVPLETHQIQFVATFVVTFYHLFIDAEYLLSHYQNYKPPLLNRDVCVLIQSFLC